MMVEDGSRYTLVVPCYNEADAIESTLRAFRETLGPEDRYDLLVVNDGSTDGTREILSRLASSDPHLRIIDHSENRGYGASLKTGIRNARTELIAITDADCTYPVDRIPDLVAQTADADMVVGARTGDNVQYSRLRKIPKIFLRRYASWIARHEIPDINSGMRVFRKSIVLSFFNILPDTFSFTTTITLAMLTNFYRVTYVPIDYSERVGTSKIRPIRDTLKFVQLILRTGMYFAPLRVFFPFILVLSAAFLVSLWFDVFILQNLTDKTVLLLLFSMNTGMFALLADMIDKRSSR